MVKDTIITKLRTLTNHDYIELTSRGNTAIESALSIIPKDKTILIPEEGGWLSYKTIPKRLGLEIIEIKCDDAKINLHDLKDKLLKHKPATILYQNPGGYFAQQPMEEVYSICKKNHCLVIMDVSGSIGTELCNGQFADILVCSFGKWKLIDAGKGGFISCKSASLWNKVKSLQILDDEVMLLKISHKIDRLPERISHLEKVSTRVINDLRAYDVAWPGDTHFVIVAKFATNKEKENIINYCKSNDLEWTECPRYIRLNKPAVSIEIKRHGS